MNDEMATRVILGLWAAGVSDARITGWGLRQLIRDRLLRWLAWMPHWEKISISAVYAAGHVSAAFKGWMQENARNLSKLPEKHDRH